MSGDDRGHAPAVGRNRAAILGVLREVLPDRGGVLELASGTGEHVCYLASHFGGLVFQPSDPDEAARRSIAAWIESEGLENVRPPLAIRAQDDDWGLGTFADGLAAVLNINMIHISPWSACEGLMRGAGRVLSSGAPLYLYGPYRRDGRHTAASNEDFDRSLRARNPAWGVRDLEQVVSCAHERGFSLERVIEMPANNLSVVLRAGGERAQPDPGGRPA